MVKNLVYKRNILLNIDSVYKSKKVKLDIIEIKHFQTFGNQ